MKVRCLLLAWAVLLPCLFAVAAEQLELNSATLDQIKALPITSEQAEAIWNRLQYEGPFHNVYELSELPELDTATLVKLRDLVRVNPPRPIDERMQRIEDAYYRIENLGTEEGTNVGLVDEWIDRLMEPLNVNEATLDELMDLQNVSPADAVAIYRQVKKQGGIRSTRDLRAVPGLSDWGYRNARNYVGYEGTAPSTQRLHGQYTFRTYNTPFFVDDEVAVRPALLVDPRPDVSHKLRVTLDRNYKAGILWHRNIGEDNYYANNGTFKIPEMKWFFGIEKHKLGPVNIARAYIGNYQVSFGQGLVMESGDYFSPRYSGYGFDKRITGIAPDLSRSQEFTLRGAAVEAYCGKFKGTGFFSAQKKDAILNPDGSMNRLITLVPRDDQDIYPTLQALPNKDTVSVPAFEGKQSMVDAVTEVGFGGELAYRPWIGTSIGLTATQFMYDKPLKPDFGTPYVYAAKTRRGTDTLVEIYPVIDPTQRDEIADVTNSEILESYRSSGTSSLWSGAKSLERIYGLNAEAVVNNFTFEFEYGELEKQGSYIKIADDPHALVASVHAQWNSLMLLALYRDYSIGYDNPYNRGFSNYARFKGTTYQDDYYLSNSEFAQVERNASAPQAERGVYFQSRYQVSRPLTFETEIDNWKRVADDGDYYRWVGKFTYRPVWPIVLRLRQKLQGRWQHDPEKETGFTTYENRVNVEFRLSRFDNLELLYASGYTRFTPRPRLSGEADPTGSYPIDAETMSPTEAVGAQMTHYFSPVFSMRASWIIYDGFFWNFEDSDFAVVQGKSARWWVSVTDRLSNSLSARFKVTGDGSNPITWIQSRKNNNYPTVVAGHETTGEDVTTSNLSFRIQLDYLF